VKQIVEPQRLRQSVVFKNLLEMTIARVTPQQESSGLARKNQITLLVISTKFQNVFGLTGMGNDMTKRSVGESMMRQDPKPASKNSPERWT
jgi:hypothetical protein